MNLDALRKAVGMSIIGRTAPRAADAAIATVLQAVAEDLEYMANGGSLETDATVAYLGRANAYRRLMAEVMGAKG